MRGRLSCAIAALVLVAGCTVGPEYAKPASQPNEVKPFDPDEILNLTTYLAVVDKDHNMVSVTSSLLSGFGSGMVVEGGGFFLNDRMRYWWLDPDNVNSLQPGKRVRQTINPALALRGRLETAYEVIG